MKDGSAKRQSNEEAVNMRHELILILKSDHLGEALWRCVDLLNLMYSHNAYPMFFGVFLSFHVILKDQQKEEFQAEFFFVPKS